MKYKLIYLVIILLLLTPALALPNSNTDETGDSCERGHDFDYNYSFEYDKNLKIKNSYELKLSFSISDSKVTRNPYDVKIKLIPHGFKLSQDIIMLSNEDKIITIIPFEKNPSLTVMATLILDGDSSEHEGYKATYKDLFELDNFIISNSKTFKLNISNKEILNDNLGNNLDLPNKIISLDNKIITEETTINLNKLNTNINIQVNTPSKVPWYIVRITGVIAFILLSLSILIALLRKINILNYSKLFSFHKDISILAIIFTFLHIVNNIWDKYEWSLNFRNIFWFDFSSITKVMISLGIFAFYLLFLLFFTSIFLKIIKIIKYKRWYFIHLLSYILYILVIIHSIFLGTDLNIANIENPLILILFFIFLFFTLLNFILLISFLVIKVKCVKK